MIQLIPAIDLIDGKCVRLSRGDYASCRVYDTDPVEVARHIEDIGITRLHVVDLDGAKAQNIVNQKALESIASKTKLTIDFGGGVKSEADVQAAFDAGASLVTLGSIAATDEAQTLDWLAHYGARRLILGADVLNGKIRTHGWLKDSHLEILPFVKQYVNAGFTQVLCTDISKDGMLSGTAVDLYRSILAECPTCHLIASGGVGAMSDIDQLAAAGVPAVVFGKALYEGRIGWADLEKRIKEGTAC